MADKLKAREGLRRQVDRKPRDDESKAAGGWDYERRVRLPHDQLMDRYALTRTEFYRASAALYPEKASNGTA